MLPSSRARRRLILQLCSIRTLSYRPLFYGILYGAQALCRLLSYGILYGSRAFSRLLSHGIFYRAQAFSRHIARRRRRHLPRLLPQVRVARNLFQAAFPQRVPRERKAGLLCPQLTFDARPGPVVLAVRQEQVVAGHEPELDSLEDGLERRAVGAVGFGGRRAGCEVVAGEGIFERAGEEVQGEGAAVEADAGEESGEGEEAVGALAVFVPCGVVAVEGIIVDGYWES